MFTPGPSPVDLYLDLLARTLTGMTREDPPIDPWHGVLKDASGRLVDPTQATTAGVYTVEPGPYRADVRELGQDWPATAETMIGLRRLHHLGALVEDVLVNCIEGDLLEAGVWRGGACIYMRAVLKAFRDSRQVYVCDSFQGLPPPARAQDAGDHHSAYPPLSVSQREVAANFERYGLLDGQVTFVPGFFAETMPRLLVPKLALLRLDGDMYGSTMDVLQYMYPRLSVGGYCVIDDFNLPAVREALYDYWRVVNLPPPNVESIDNNGVFWKKEN